VRRDKGANDKVHFFSKHFSGIAGFALLRCGLTPNQITFLFLICGMSAGLSLYWGAPLLAYGLWRLHIILDMADGTVARATGNFSPHAGGFDKASHIAINTTVLLAPLAQSVHLALVNGLLVAFYLYYFFSLLFPPALKKSAEFSLRTNLMKHAIGLEGYLLVQAGLIAAQRTDLAGPAAVFFTCTFLALFGVKLARHLKK